MVLKAAMITALGGQRQIRDSGTVSAVTWEHSEGMHDIKLFSFRLTVDAESETVTSCSDSTKTSLCPRGRAMFVERKHAL